MIKRNCIFGKKKGFTIRIDQRRLFRKKSFIKKYGKTTTEAMFDVLTNIKTYESLANKIDYLFRLGITEADDKFSRTIKSMPGIGSLLLKVIRDTIRTSLSTDPVEE